MFDLIVLIGKCIVLFVGFAMLTIVALVVSFCCGNYALNLGQRLYWYRRAQRVTGTLLNVVKIEGELVSFYRYTLPTGAAFEARSFVPATSCEDGALYSQTTLLVFPDIPEVVCEESDVFAGVFSFAIPLFMLYILICQTTSEGRFTLWTWVATGAVIAYIGTRFCKGLRAPY
jgi:hypothetical protein